MKGALVVGLALGLAGCAHLVDLIPGGPPGLPPPPPGEPPKDEHVPLCASPELVSACWHQPPEGWLYACPPDGARSERFPSLCPDVEPEEPPKKPEEPPAENTCRHWDGPGPEKGLFEDDVNLAIDSACKRAGVTCGLDGPKRPGKWKEFVAHAADVLEALRYTVTYDYLNGEAEGRASEMSVKKGNRVENYQIETAEGRVRRPHGAYRSVCEPACCEGQPIQREAAPPAKPTKCAPALTGFRDVYEHSRAGRRINLNTTPEHCDSETGSDYCARVWNGRRCCPVGPGEGDDRKVCEAELVGHVVVTALRGAIERTDYNEAAPVMAVVITKPTGWEGGLVSICAEKAPTVCVEAVIAR